MATGLAIPILFVLTGPIGQQLRMLGVLNRITIAVHCIWTVLLAMRLLRGPTTSNQSVGIGARSYLIFDGSPIGIFSWVSGRRRAPTRDRPLS